ncbi:Metal-nicotianamine transporter YSL1, partial [Camellia lanceoleosa]
ILIVDYKLTFPSGMATAILINGFHNQGEKMARKQVHGFMKVFSVSFFWGFFQWFYSGKDICGFAQFPTFGLRAWKNTFYFDFSMTYVGTGTICPHIVNLSTLLGAVLSWGVMWPLLANFKGLWFPYTIPESSMKSLNGYKVFLSIALLLGDGIYNFIKVICITFLSIHGKLKQKNLKSEESSVKSLDILKQNEVFIRESIPLWVGASGYILFTFISVIVIPFIFPEVKWYYVIMSYLLAPSLAFCDAYGAGLIDINMSYNYDKVGLFALAALVGKQHGVVAGLAKESNLTSPWTMLVSQAIGTAIGCVVSLLYFLLFYKGFDVGNPNVGINLVKDFSPMRIGKWMPLPMAMAVPFLVGAYFSIDMCVGTLIVFVWHKLNPKKAELMVPVVASGLICGEGLWTLPESILSLARVNPPMCMKFVAS